MLPRERLRHEHVLRMPVRWYRGGRNLIFPNQTEHIFFLNMNTVAVAYVVNMTKSVIYNGYGIHC